MNWDLTDYHPLLAQRAAVDRHLHDRPAAVGRLPAGDRDPRGARPQLPAHPLRRGRAGGRRGAGHLQPLDRPVRGRPRRRHLPEVGGDRRSGRDRPGRHARASTARPFSLPNGEILASYAANVTDPANATPQYDLVAVDARDRRAPDAARRAAPSRSSRRRSATSAPSGCCSRNLPQLVFGGHSGQHERRRRRSCTSPTSRCWRRCSAPTCAAGATSRPSTRATALKVYQEQPPPNANPGGLSGLAEYVYTQPDVAGRGPARGGPLAQGRSSPRGKPLILELVDGGGNPLFTMTRGAPGDPGEYITPGPAARGVQRHLRRLPRQPRAARSWTSRSAPTPSPAPRSRCRATCIPKSLQ